MNDEHDDDMSAEVGENAVGEADEFAVVADDIEARDVDEARERLQELDHNLATAEGDDVEEG